MARSKPAKRKVQRVHTASATLSVPSLTKAGSSLWRDITAGGQLLGKLEIGRGGFYWTGRHRKSSKRISWSRFADLMDQRAYG